jgi:hypothetical protein
MIDWSQRNEGLEERAFTCGHCGKGVGTGRGYFSNNSSDRIYLCPYCWKPTFFSEFDDQVPGVAYGSELEHLPDEIKQLYDEARNCMSVNAYTAAVMACRKLLMNVAVKEEAEEGESFAFYVGWLADNGYVPKKGKEWVDRIRTKGNEANHEIPHIEPQDAKDVLLFTEMLLNLNYELPALADQESGKDAEPIKPPPPTLDGGA